MLLFLLACASSSACCSATGGGVRGVDPGPVLPVFVGLKDGDTVYGRVPLQVYARTPALRPLEADEVYEVEPLWLRMVWSSDGQDWRPIGEEVLLSSGRLLWDPSEITQLSLPAYIWLRATLSDTNENTGESTIRFRLELEPEPVGSCTCLELVLEAEPPPVQLLPADLPVGPWSSPLRAKDVAEIQERQRSLLAVVPDTDGKVFGSKIFVRATVDGDPRACQYTQQARGEGTLGGRPYTLSPTAPQPVSETTTSFHYFWGENQGATWTHSSGLLPGALSKLTLLQHMDHQIWTAHAVGTNYSFETRVSCTGRDGSSATLHYRATGGLSADGRPDPLPVVQILPEL